MSACLAADLTQTKLPSDCAYEVYGLKKYSGATGDIYLQGCFKGKKYRKISWRLANFKAMSVKGLK